jgi:tetratricopeptide (TPR) repeat protein
VKEALALKLPELARFQPLLAIDAWHLTGNAQLLANRPAEAQAAFAKALALCGQEQPYTAAHLLLVQSEALRRGEQFEQANATWVRAVESAGWLLAGDRPVGDPILWERAAYLRPLSTLWPIAVANRLGQLGQAGVSAMGQPADEALVWCGIGKLRLERGESQAALVAYKRAESMTADAAFRGQLQLGQAQALLQLGQQPSAIAILAPLTKQANPALAASALALVGAARYHGGSPTQAVGFLRQALAMGGDWPGRAEAEADLALAHLSLGQEPEGLELLHRAQQTFESAGKFLALRQSLLNEREYCSRRQKHEEASRIDNKLAQMEQQ